MSTKCICGAPTPGCNNRYCDRLVKAAAARAGARRGAKLTELVLRDLGVPAHRRETYAATFIFDGKAIADKIDARLIRERKDNSALSEGRFNGSERFVVRTDGFEQETTSLAF